MARDETRDVFVLTEDGSPEMSESCISVVEGTIRDEVASEGQDETRYVPHSDLADLERQLLERADERDGALFSMLQAREALQAGNDELALHILEDDSAIDDAIEARERISDLERQLAEREDAIRRMQEAANELALRERGLRAALCEAVDVIGRATNLQMVPMARDLLCATLETAVDALEAKP